MGCWRSQLVAPQPLSADPFIAEPDEAAATPIHHTPDSLPPTQRYRLLEELGRGHFAKVRRCVDTVTGIEYAIKIIDKKDLVKSLPVVKAEMEILRAVGRHPNVVSLVDQYEDENEFYLVMELCKGGDLFSKIVEEGKYTEKQAMRCCRQLASALQWIHKCGVTHRDLKPENILLTSDDIDASIKVADFGLSKLIRGSHHIMRTVCGTWAYCAPEVIARKPYTQAVDVWTLGVLMFILLSGYHPFDVYGDMAEAKLLKKILACEYDFDDEVWNHVSENAKQLIRGLLKVDPDGRISLDTYLASPWIQGEGVNDKQMTVVVDRLSKFNVGRTKFRALVIAKLASKKFRASIHSSTNKALISSPSDAHRGSLLSMALAEQQQQSSASTEVQIHERTKGGLGTQPRSF